MSWYDLVYVWAEGQATMFGCEFGCIDLSAEVAGTEAVNEVVISCKWQVEVSLLASLSSIVLPSNIVSGWFLIMQLTTLSHMCICGNVLLLQDAQLGQYLQREQPNEFMGCVHYTVMLLG